MKPDKDAGRSASARQIRSVIDRVVHEGTAVARSDGSVHKLFPTAINAKEGEALLRWVSNEAAQRTIEIGLGYGISALFICEGLFANGNTAARHVVIDPFQRTRFADCGLQALEEAGLESVVEHHSEASQIVLPRFQTEGRSFDLAFVDGDHRFDGVFLDLVYLGKLVRKGGIIVLDDYQLPAIVHATSFFLKNLGWTLEEVSGPDPHHQWAVLRTSTIPDTRPFDYFIDF
jgi:predicted O-methyltransferase YrrM